MPDFADGFGDIAGDNSYWNKTDGQGQRHYSAPFHKITIAIPAEADLSTIAIKVDYDESVPSLAVQDGYGSESWATESAGANGQFVQLSGYTYAPLSGSLRIWKKDGPIFRGVQSVTDGGDYVPKNIDDTTPYVASNFNLTDTNRKFDLYVEGIAPSSNEGDKTVRITTEYALTSSDNNEVSETVTKLETFRFTVLQAKLVKVDATGAVIPDPDSDAMFDSHPSPVINVNQLNIESVKAAPDGAAIWADIRIAGSVTCSLCDLIPGVNGGSDEDGDPFTEGTVSKLYAFVNEYEESIDSPIHLKISKTKPGESGSTFGRPYAFVGTFDETLKDVPVEPFTNKLILASTFAGAPPPSGAGANREDSSFTGFIEYTFNVNAVVPLPNQTTPIATYDQITLLELTAHLDGSYQLSVQTEASELSEYALSAASSNPRVFKSASSTQNPAAWFIRHSETYVAMSVPALGIWDTMVPLKPVAVISGVGTKYEIDSTPNVHVVFPPSLDPNAPDSVSISINSALPVTLTEDASEPSLFVSNDATLQFRLISPDVGSEVFEIFAQVSSVPLGWDERGFKFTLALSGSTLEYTTAGVEQDFSIDEASNDSNEGANFGFDFSASAPNVATPVNRSTGGELNAYGTQIIGPTTLLEKFAKDESVEVVKAPSGQFLNSRLDIEAVVLSNGNLVPPATSALTPAQRAQRKAALLNAYVSAPDTPWWKLIDVSSVGDDFVKFMLGFGKGFGMGAVGCLTNTAKSIGGAVKDKFNRLLHPTAISVQSVSSELQHATLRWRQAGSLVSIVGNAIWKYVKDGDMSVLKKVAAGEHPEVNALSEEVRMTVEIGIGLFQDLIDEFQKLPELLNLSPYEQGEAFGKFMFEIFSNLAPMAKAGKLAALGGKLKALEGLPAKLGTKFSHMASNAHPRVGQIVEKIGDAAKKVAEAEKTVVQKFADLGKPPGFNANNPKHVANSAKRNATRLDTNYRRLAATVLDRKQRLDAAVNESTDPPNGWDGFLVYVYNVDFCSYYSANDYPDYKWSHNLIAVLTAKGINRNAPTRSLKKDPIKDQRAGSKWTLESHHGAPRYMQYPLILVSSGEQPTKSQTDRTPSMLMTRFRHTASSVLTANQTNSIHRLLEEYGAGDKAVTKSEDYDRDMAIDALQKAYNRQALGAFGSRVTGWLTNTYRP